MELDYSSYLISNQLSYQVKSLSNHQPADLTVVPYVVVSVSLGAVVVCLESIQDQFLRLKFC